MENEIDLFTLADFRLKLEEVSNYEVYNITRIKQTLQEKYKENILFAEVSGRKNFVCFRNMDDWIISDQWYDNKRQNVDDEAKNILKMPQKLSKTN